MKKKLLSIFVLFIIYIFISCYCYSINSLNNIENNIFRLHIIANSNSELDQNLKLKVRDNILSYMNCICEKAFSKDEAIEIAKNHINEFREIADKTILENGFNYASEVEIGNYNFPTKYYGDISLPCGCYDALEIKLGKHSGQNWWCVLYPSLCFVDVSSGTIPEKSKEILKNNLSDEEYSLISRQTPAYDCKFKIIELFNDFFK